MILYNAIYDMSMYMYAAAYVCSGTCLITFNIVIVMLTFEGL